MATSSGLDCRIINVTSVNDIAPAPFGGWYSASKAALASLSAVLGAELQGSGIFVTVVAPGLFRTAMSEQLPCCQVADGSGYAAAFATLRDRNAAALESAGDPDEVASAIGRAPTWYRPPYGVATAATFSACGKLGLQPVLWSAWGRDWTATATPESVFRLVARDLRGGGTVLLHDSDCTSSPGSWKATLAALPLLAYHWDAAGLTVGPLADHGL